MNNILFHIMRTFKQLFFVGYLLLAFGIIAFFGCIILFKLFDLEKIRHLLRYRSVYKKFNAYNAYAEQCIHYATNEDELWKILCEASAKYGLKSVEWSSPDETRFCGDRGGNPEKAVIPLLLPCFHFLFFC